METVAVILSRRSIVALAEPGPNAQQLELMLRAATTVPDHGSLRPYRFLVSDGAGRERFGNALAAAMLEARPESPPAVLEKVRAKASAAPTQVLLIAAPHVGHKIAEWEQLAAAACTGYAIALTAHALGLGASWKNAPFDRGAALCEHLGLAPHERLLGWINVGQIAQPAAERPAVDLRTLVGVVGADGITAYEGPA